MTLCAQSFSTSPTGELRSLSVSSMKLSNGLPYKIKRENSLLFFKNAMKTYLINSYIDIDNFEILLQMFLS